MVRARDVQGPPLILRLFGRGTPHPLGSAEFAALEPRFPTIPGARSIVLVEVLLSRPAIIKLWPEPSSMVVSARRTVNAGTEKPLSVIAPWLESSDTSGRTRSEMRPLERTVGV